MASVNYDSNKQDNSDTTNVLAPSSSGQPASTPQPQTSTTAPVSTTTSTNYVSNGNPYGSYAQPSGTQPSTNAGTQSARKSNTGASSGQFTNVQSYVDKNQQSAQNLGTATAGKLQNTSDIAKQNLQSVENKFGQGMNAGSLENYQGAVGEVKTAANEAANQTSANKTWNANAASMYAPAKTDTGTYSAADQALVDKNLARVLYGDGSTKDFATQAEATDAINSYNTSNPGYYTYGNEKDLSVSDDRLKDILNAKYQGPNELSEIAGYGNAYNKFQDASTLQNQVLKGGSNNELLNRTFAEQGDYTAGSKLLDDLLLGQGAANQTLRGTAEKLGSTSTGKLGDEFSSRAKDARTSAIARTGEIDTVKNEARQALTDTSLTRNKEVNDRINGVIENWDKYPQYFRDRFTEQLGKHNELSTKKKEYDQVAPVYETAKQTVDQITKNNPILQQYDINKYTNQANDLAISKYRNAQSSFGKRAIDDPEYANIIESRIPGFAAAKQHRQELDAILKATGTLNGLFSNDTYGTKIDLSPLIQKANELKQAQQTMTQVQPQYDALSQYASFDPNALNLELSQLESEALGVQGGEGLYNLLKDQGVEGLLKTAAYDKNKLVSGDEQSQLNRLQSIAQLASDYGVKGSGLDFKNQFTNRDIAGQQNATSALDMDNFKNLLQGSERNFRTDAAGSNIAGQGYGTGSSGGMFDTKRAQSWKTLNQNFGDLLSKNDAYRNMYSDEGINNDLLKSIVSQSKGKEGFNLGNVDPGVIGGVVDAAALPGDMLKSVLGGVGVDKNLSNVAMLTNPVTAPLALAGMFGNFVGGSSAEAQGRADYAASIDALANLQKNVQNKINTTGLKNQLSVGQNTNQDLELFKLLGLLDTTNL